MRNKLDNIWNFKIIKGYPYFLQFFFIFPFIQDNIQGREKNKNYDFKTTVALTGSRYVGIKCVLKITDQGTLFIACLIYKISLKTHSVRFHAENEKKVGGKGRERKQREEKKVNIFI